MNLPSFRAISASIALAMTAQANPVDLSPPNGIFEFMDAYGQARYVLEYQELNAGDGVKLPFRFIFNSSVGESPYRWSGWSVPLFEAFATRSESNYWQVSLLCGKKLYFQFPVSWTTGGSVEPKPILDDGTSKDASGEWTAELETMGNDDKRITVTRWDGWQLVYRAGRLIRLTTDTAKVIEWEYSGPNDRLGRILLKPTNIVLLEITYATDGNRPVSIAVNDDVYSLGIGYQILNGITHPDGTSDTFTYTNFSTANLALHYSLSDPAAGDVSLQHINRYGVSQTLTWQPWTPPEETFGGIIGANIIPGDLPLLKSDGVWDYEAIDSNPVNLHHSPGIERTRIATDETEKIEFAGTDDSQKIYTSSDGSKVRVSENRSPGRAFGKVTKVERWMDDAWVQIHYVAYNASNGRVIRTTDANNEDTVYTYTDHPGGNTFLPPLTKTVTDPTNRAWTYQYDTRGNLVRRTDAAGINRYYENDSRDRLFRVRDNANTVIAEYTYNDNDRVATVKNAAGQTTKFTYLDRYGESLLEKVILPSDNESAGEFAALFTYDGRGNLTKFTDANGAEWDYEPNAENLTEKITDPNDHETEFAYDTRANVAQITDALEQVTTLGYDDFDLIDTVTDAFTQTSEYSTNASYQLAELEDNRAKSYEFDYSPEGYRKSLKFPDNSEITADFDLSDRLTEWTGRGDATVTITARDDAGRIQTTTSAYEGFTRTSTYGYDTGGRLNAATATVGSIPVPQSFGYDSEGRFNTVTQGLRTAGLTYDAASRVQTITYPAGFSITYVYDGDGRISQIKRGTDVLVEYIYDAAGRLDQREDASGVITEYGYDALSRLNAITITKSGSGTLWSAEYGYNALGNRSYTRTTPTTGDVYRYDAIGQVTGVKYGATDPEYGYNLAVNPAATEEISYDAAGNRLTVGNGVSSGGYSVNDLNQYTATPGSVTPAYNSRGDLTDFNSGNANDWEFTFDAEGHLVAAEQGSSDPIQYHYDAFGDRAARQDGPDFTWFLNIGSEMLEAYDATTASATSYVYAGGIDQPVAQITDAGDVEFLHQDVLGNVVLVTNESGNVLEKYTYGIWGYVSATDAVGNPVATPRSRFLFTGRELDVDTGLYHYRTRAYSPQIGRFLQMDSIDFYGGDLNLYRYVSNDPVNWIDPYGHLKEAIGAAIARGAVGAAVGAGIGAAAGGVGAGPGAVIGAVVGILFTTPTTAHAPTVRPGPTIGSVSTISSPTNGPGRRNLNTNPDFRRWFHKEWKADWKKDGNPDATDEELDEAYLEWLSEGCPKVD